MAKHVWAAAVILLWAGAVRAEDIEGKVTNAQGSAVAGVKITAAPANGEAPVEVTTGPDGSYSFVGLGPGIYTVTVSMPAGQSSLRREVAVGNESGIIQAHFQFSPVTAQAVSGSEESNPNIFVYRIDLNELRNRLTIGRGPDPQYIPEFRADQNYMGAEYGAPLLSFEIVRPRSLLSSWRGSVSALHQNSALNARNFRSVKGLALEQLFGDGERSAVQQSFSTVAIRPELHFGFRQREHSGTSAERTHSAFDGSPHQRHHRKSSQSISGRGAKSR